MMRQILDFPCKVSLGFKPGCISKLGEEEMRGDQLARQWRNNWAIEASRNELTVAEIAQREETVIRTTQPDLEALQAAGFPLYTQEIEKANRWAFIAIFKFKIPPPFTINESMFIFFAPPQRAACKESEGKTWGKGDAAGNSRASASYP
jgi:hypothetical protein